MMDDAAYLHSPTWGFLPVAYTGQVSEDPGRVHTEFRAMGGGRSVTYRPTVARSWSVGGKVPLDWAQSLLMLRDGVYGQGPFAWVPPLAQRHNALMGGFVDAVAGKPAKDDTGSLVVAHDVTVRLVTPTTPVAGGTPVTGSAWVKAGSVFVEFLSADDVVISTHTVAHPGGGVLQRLSVSATAPASTAKAVVAVSADAVLAGQPALTWRPQVTGYIPPSACRSVFVEHSNVGHSTLGPDADATLVDVSFNVMEVG